MVVAEVLLLVRLSVQFQQLMAENDPEVAVVWVFVMGAVSTEKIVVRIRAILPAQRIIKRESQLFLPIELDSTRRAHTNNTGGIMTG